MRGLIIAALAALAVAGAAQADVTSAGANSLAIRQVLRIAAPPAEVYAALITPGRWWDSAHSWSGDAANMTLDPTPGGCFCETLPASGGATEHGRVIHAAPGRLLRLNAALGPFQAMAVAGVLSWELKPVDGGTELSQYYTVGGFVPGGAEAIAPAVDGVMSGQIGRLKAFVEKR